MAVDEIGVLIRIELADASDHEEKDSNTSEPPSHCDTRGKAGCYQENRPDDVANDGKCFHNQQK